MSSDLVSELERLGGGTVAAGEHERSMYARDLWPLQTVRFRRAGKIVAPAAVVRPQTVDDVRRLVAWCSDHGVALLPYGGGSGVCGGVLCDPADLDGRDAVVCDLKALTGVESVSMANLWCTALAGTLGMDYEQTLESRGLTGGHYPQSLYASTVGGWLACRSAGQASTGYGRGEDLVRGLDVVLASGDLVHFAPQPATAAGPDLMRLFIGSEGTLGVIVRATLKVFPAPELRRFQARRFASFSDGLNAVRAVLQAGVRPAVVRLYDPADAAFAFPDTGGSVLVVITEGTLADAEMDVVGRVCSDAADLGEGPARHWLAHRFDGAWQLANVLKPDGLLGPHAVADTLEVAGPWTQIEALYDGVREALTPHTVAVLCHASHFYPDGACLYFTFAVQGPDETEAEERYEAAWKGALDASLSAGGTISHHHGVGRLKAAWLRRELGDPAWTLLASVKRMLDPRGVLNPGNLGLR